MSLSDYWMKRGRGYRGEFQRHGWLVNRRFKQQEKEVIRNFKLLEFSSVLEIGCGFGRITKILTDTFPIQRYDAFDLSEDQIDNAKKYVGNAANFTVGNILDYPTPSNRYDIVCAFEVFMHIPPDQIATVIEKAVQMSNRYVVNLDWCAASEPVEAGGYCFQHNYPELYHKAGATTTQTVNLNDHWLSKVLPSVKLRQKQFLPSVKLRQKLFIAQKIAD